MAKRIFVAICESNPVFRAGLASLLKEESFRVCATVAELKDLGVKPRKWPDELIVLMGYHRDTVLDEAGVLHLHKVCPSVHIVLLAESISEECRRQAEAAGAQGILVRSVSQDVLAKSLELVALGGCVYSHTAMGAADRPGASETGADQVAPSGERRIRAVAESDRIPARGQASMPDPRPSRSAVPLQENSRSANAREEMSASSRMEHLSEREKEILHYLVNGFPNKIIARNCRISDATVKVHVKSILRKIGVANRTQAAVWAMLNIEGEPAASARKEPANESDVFAGSADSRDEAQLDRRSKVIPLRNGANRLC